MINHIDFPYQELAVQGWFTNEHYILFFTPFTASQKSGPNQMIRQYLETLKALGYRIICVHYLVEYQKLTEQEQREADEQFMEYADYYYKVPLKTAVTDTDPHVMNMHMDDWCGEEAVQKVGEIYNTFSVSVCFVSCSLFSSVFEVLPARIRKVLILDTGFIDDNMNMHLPGIAGSGRALLLTEETRSACQRADVVVTDSQQGSSIVQRLVPDREVYFFPLARKNERLDQRATLSPEQIMQKVLATPFAVPEETRDHFLHYHDVMMKVLYRYIKDPKDKIFVEIGPDDYLSLARTLKANGAARVIVVQTFKQKDYDLPEGIEFQVVSPTRWESIKDSSVDIIYGVGVLEHITHFEEIANEICRVLKPGGRVLLQGCPLWGSSQGHHVVVSDENTGIIKYDFTQADKNPIEPWMHLALTEKEMREKLVQKNISKQDAQKITDMIYRSNIGSNKKLAEEIVSPFKKKLHVEAVRYLAYPEKNAYYDIAREKYSKKDLQTDCFIIYARKLN